MLAQRFCSRLLAPVLLLAALAAPASAASITPLVGYQWGGTLDFINGDVHIEAAMNYGGAISQEVRPGYLAELMYTYQASEMIARPNVGSDFKLFDLSTHYAQINGTRLLGYGDQKATPFVMGGLGMTIFAPGESSLGEFDTQWLFSLSIGGGVMVQANERTSIRLQARFLMPMNYTEGGVYFGTGGGGLSISGNTIPQGDASVGITFALGQ
jgi:hypothetical protein